LDGTLSHSKTFHVAEHVGACDPLEIYWHAPGCELLLSKIELAIIFSKR